MFARALVLTIGSLAAAQPAGEPPVSVQIGLFSYREDGTNSSSTTISGTNGGPFDGTLYAMSPCGFGATSAGAPGDSVRAWHVAGQTGRVTANQATVEVQWSRTRPAAPGGTRKLTLAPGVPVALDSVRMDPPKECDAIRLVLEARLAPRLVPAAANDAPDNGRGVASSSASPSSSSAVSATTYDAELTLVRRTDSGDEASSPTHVRLSAAGARFTFPPLTAPVSGGQATISVEGTLGFSGTGAGRELAFTATRTVHYPRPAAPSRFVQSENATTRATQGMPGPDEEISFEMPPIRSQQGAAITDRFIVRLKVRPAGAADPE